MTDDSGASAQHQADQRFVDAVLRERHRSRGGEVELAVTRALAEMPATQTPVRRWAPMSIAAVLIAAVGFVWVSLDPAAPSARAVIDRALEAAQEDVDRRYEVTITREADPRRGTSREVSRLWLDVRGSECFLLEALDGPMQGARFGSDGLELWIVPEPSIFPALHGDLPPMLQDWLDRKGVDLPFLKVASVLERLGEDYDVELEPSGAGRLSEIDATRRPDAPGPEQVRLQVEEDGTVPFLTTEWSARRDDGVGVRVELTLVEQVARPDDWFRLSTHAGDRRAVEFHDMKRDRREK